MIVYLNGAYSNFDEVSIAPSNRSFRYGDGLFESMRLVNDHMLFWSHHYSRFILGMDYLKILIPEAWQPKFFEEIILRLVKENNFKHARVRMMCFRSGEGLYQSNSNEPGLYIELQELDKPYFHLNTKGLSLGLFEEVKKPIQKLSSFKTNNSLPYVLAANYCSENNLDDCLVLNTEGRVAEVTSSNIFTIKGSKIYTPNDNEGGINGVMRTVLTKLIKKIGLELEKVEMSIEDVKGADEVFITNASKGIQWIEKFGESTYTSKLSSMILAKLNERVMKDSNL